MSPTVITRASPRFAVRSLGVSLAACCTIALLAAPAGAEAPIPCPPDSEGCELVLEVTPDAVDEVLETLAESDVEAEQIAERPYISVAGDSAETADAVGMLDRSGHVEDVELDAPRSLHAFPNDPFAQQQRTYLDPIRLPQLWDRAPAGVARGQRIAVIDSGVNSHDDLNGQVVGRYDAITGGSTLVDENGHGTLVAGIAAAQSNNSRGVAGAGWGAQILAVDVGTETSIRSSDVAKGIDWAVANGADVINLSLGGPSSTPVEQAAVADAIGAGVVVVASAGNDSTTQQSYPAALPGVIAVASTNQDGSRLSGFSNRGFWVDIAVPGERIVGLDSSGNNYVLGVGTSFSAPIISGAVAVLRARQPSLRPAQIEAALRTYSAPPTEARPVRLASLTAVADALGFTAPRSTPIAGDWDGDGIDDVGWFRAGTFALRRGDGRVITFPFGRAGDRPVTGDWDGDGDDEIGIVRAGQWYLRPDARRGGTTVSFGFGRATDTPVAVALTRGRTGIGVVRGNTWYLRSVASAGPTHRTFAFGRATDTFVTGDWDGNGIDGVGVVRGSAWYLRAETSTTSSVTATSYGRSTDSPVAGDWDGNRSSSPGLARLSSFFRSGASTIYYPG